MTHDYLDAVRAHLDALTHPDRRRALDALSAQLEELAAAGIDPATALGDPAAYAARLRDALAEDPPPDGPRWRVLGLPVETRGPTSADVRSRIWDPANPRVLVPRLFGMGWTVNLGALAVRLGLIRPDDADADVLALIPPRNLRAAQAVPAVVAGAAAAAVALTWRRLPPTVPSGFDAGGRSRGEAPRGSLLVSLALGVVPALWAQRTDAPPEDRLVRAANATSLSVLSAATTAATIVQARAPHGRWGLLVPAAMPAAAATALAVLVVPLRSGLRRAWRAAATPPEPAPESAPEPAPAPRPASAPRPPSAPPKEAS